MASKKRSSDDTVLTKRKKPKLSQTQPPAEENVPSTSLLRPDDVDFPRGGGTSLTAVEYKSVKAEALKELQAELVFKVLALVCECRGAHSFLARMAGLRIRGGLREATRLGPSPERSLNRSQKERITD